MLTDEVPALYARREVYNVREKDKDAVRTNFAAHLYSRPFATLARHPRMVVPVMDLFNEPVYMHQFKINGKAAFDGDVWQWHQDYGTWLNDDPMPTERAMNVAIFLDDVNEFNGPLMFIPGSHKKGVVDARHDTTTTSYPLWTLDHDQVAQLVERAGGKAGGIVSPTGPAGSMILFHSCLVHASGSNLSPWHRVSVVPEPVRGQQPYPPLQAARSTSRTATSRRSRCCPTTACRSPTRSSCRGATACRRARCRPSSVPFDEARQAAEASPSAGRPAAGRDNRRRAGVKRRQRRRAQHQRWLDPFVRARLAPARPATAATHSAAAAAHAAAAPAAARRPARRR